MNPKIEKLLNTQITLTAKQYSSLMDGEVLDQTTTDDALHVLAREVPEMTDAINHYLSNDQMSMEDILLLATTRLYFEAGNALSAHTMEFEGDNHWDVEPKLAVEHYNNLRAGTEEKIEKIKERLDTGEAYEGDEKDMKDLTAMRLMLAAGKDKIETLPLLLGVLDRVKANEPVAEEEFRTLKAQMDKDIDRQSSKLDFNRLLGHKKTNQFETNKMSNCEIASRVVEEMAHEYGYDISISRGPQPG